LLVHQLFIASFLCFVSFLPAIRKTDSITDFDSRYFWAWTDFQSYLDFMLVMWAVGAGVTYFMLPVNWFMETIGFLAVFTEAMLGEFGPFMTC